MHNLGRAFGSFAALAFSISILLLASPIQAADSEPIPIATGEADIALSGALASVNGVLIEQERFDAAFARIAAFSNAADANTLALDVLNSLIDEELILQFAAANDLAIDDEVVDDEIASLKGNMGAELWEDWLAENLYTAGEFWDVIHRHLTTLAVREHVTAHLHGEVLHVRARHILVARKSDAQLVIERLRTGERFGTLAAALSLDVSTRDYGGDLGWFISGELLERRLGEAAFSQALGDIGGPIATRLGYHVLQVIGRAERSIDADRLPYLTENVFKLWLEEQLKAADIRFNLEALDSLAEVSL